MTRTAMFEDLDDSMGSDVGPSNHGRKIFHSPESDEAGSNVANPLEIWAPSLIDKPFDATVNPFEEAMNSNELKFEPEYCILMLMWLGEN